jgi:hypothetical protein
MPRLKAGAGRVSIIGLASGEARIPTAEPLEGYVTGGVGGFTRETILNVLKDKRNRFKRESWLAKREPDRPQNALYQLALTGTHLLTFPALSRDLDLAPYQGDPGSRPGKCSGAYPPASGVSDPARR